MIFHYAPSLFEGMKAYKDPKGDIRLYRPMMNMQRMNRSAERLALPVSFRRTRRSRFVISHDPLFSLLIHSFYQNFDCEELLTLIKELLKVDSRWIPEGKGSSLYIRPTLIGTQPTLGQGNIAEALLFVITCPVGPYVSSITSRVGFLPSLTYDLFLSFPDQIFSTPQVSSQLLSKLMPPE